MLSSRIVAAALAAALLLPVAASAATSRDKEGRSDAASSAHRELRRESPSRRAASALRSIDGSQNNRRVPELNAAGGQLLRQVESDYADGVSALAGEERPSARHVSNRMSSQSGSPYNGSDASDYLWQWGQFLDHDIDLTETIEPPEPADIAVPRGDPYFDPSGSGVEEIAFDRSDYDPRTGVDTPREQTNGVTGWIDASNVYGSDERRARALRSNDGTGRLATSARELLPFNDAGLPNAGGADPSLFLAGDVRANEQVGLTAMHTLFVREHNRIADWIRRVRPRWGGERIYQHARRIVGAQMQVITYEEFLPVLLGKKALRPYRGYDARTDARIANVFSTAAYRFGHSALSAKLLRIRADGSESRFGHLPLRDAFFDPSRILEEGGIDELLRGLAAQRCQKIDHMVVDDVRNFLFGQPGEGGFDLASLNIQRGRDHGLPSYNEVREAFDLPPAKEFSDISSDRGVQERLAAAYASPDEVDLWAGGLAEDRAHGSHVGPTFHTILVDQFEALRDGDRFWYERSFSPWSVRILKRTRLSEVIRRNTGIGPELADDVFHVRDKGRARASRR